VCVCVSVCVCVCVRSYAEGLPSRSGGIRVRISSSLGGGHYSVLMATGYSRDMCSAPLMGSLRLE